MDILKTIPIANITPNPQQPRRVFDEDALLSLGQSIKARGLIQPIIVEEAEPEHYILHDGERRWRATQLAGLHEIKAIIVPSLNGHSDQSRLLRAFVANVQRADLNPIEEALALQSMVNMGMTHKRVADETGLTTNTVASRLLLLALDSELQDLVARDLLPRDPRVTRALLSIVDPATRIKLGIRLARPGITIPAILNACTRLNEHLAQTEVVEGTKTPSLALGTPQGVDTSRTEKWATVKASAAGMCAACDANPHFSDVPEPAWTLIMQASTQTCDACGLRQQALVSNLSICKECPAVELLKRLVAGAQ